MNDLPLSFPAAAVLGPGELDDDEYLAQAEGRIRGYGKLVVSGIVEIGRELVAVKERLPGRYNAFVSERLGWSLMQATRFVNVHAMLRLNNLLSQADDLTIDASSLYLIAAPSTPAQVREQVLEQAAKPKGISRTEVEKLIAEARQEGDTAARSEFADKLVITADELSDRLDTVDTKYATRLKRLETERATLIKQRDSARENVRVLTKAGKSKSAKSKPEPPPALSFDSTTSFRAMCISQSLAALKVELRITPKQLIDIERELAANVHNNPELAIVKLAEVATNARAVHSWLVDLLAALTE